MPNSSLHFSSLDPSLDIFPFPPLFITPPLLFLLACLRIPTSQCFVISLREAAFKSSLLDSLAVPAVEEKRSPSA